MDKDKLKTIRKSMNLNMAAMAQMLGWKYRTYQDRELGNRGIPEKAAQEVMAAQKRERETVARIIGGIVADVGRRFPLGISSEAGE